MKLQLRINILTQGELDDRVNAFGRLQEQGAAWHRGSLNTQIGTFWDGIKQFGIFNTLDLVEKKIQKLIETLKSKTVLCLSQNGPPLDFKMFFFF